MPQNGTDHFGRITNEVNDQNSIAITYDSMGQVKSQNQRLFDWDPWGRLLKVADGAFTWEASYDALGRRLQTRYTQGWNSTLTTTSFYDPEEEFQEIGVRHGNKTFWKVYGPDACDAVIDETGSSVYPIHNGLGNLTGVVSEQGTFLTEKSPSPYGILPTALFPSDLISYAQSLTWHSQGQDSTGLIWMGARYYDPRGGRFLSPDPIGHPICLDLYAYANGDPINNYDPDGRFCSPVYQNTKTFLIDTFTTPKYVTPILHSVGDAGISTANFFADVGFGLATPYYAFKNNFKWSGVGEEWRNHQQNFNSLHHKWDKAMRACLPINERGSSYTNIRSVSGSAIGGYLIVATAGKTIMQGVRSIANEIQLFRMSNQTATLSHLPTNSTIPISSEGTFYSVAFETKLSSKSYPGVSRARHFQEANSALLNSMQESAQFAEGMQKLGITISKTPTGLAPRTPPSGWTWHHAERQGVMQLVPRNQHTPGSVYWDTLHPEGQGGYAIWGQQ